MEFIEQQQNLVSIPAAARIISPSWAVDWLPEAAAVTGSQSDWDSQTLSLSQEPPENTKTRDDILKNINVENLNIYLKN